MNLPPIHNKRSPKQWDIISKHIDFKNKTVIDLGCGYADLLFRCWQAGAKCFGIDKDNSLFPDSRDTFCFEEGNIEHLGYRRLFSNVTLLFSVLPYLEKPTLMLKWMGIHSSISLIEVQLFRDGPGSNDWLKGQIENEPNVTYLVDDEDTFLLLRKIGWQSVEKIGQTLVEGRNKERSIWLCQ